MGIDLKQLPKINIFNESVQPKRDEFNMKIHIYKPDEVGIKLSRVMYKVKCGQDRVYKHYVAEDFDQYELRMFQPVSEATCEACILIHFEDQCITSE